MKRLLLFGILILISSLSMGCACFNHGYGHCGVPVYDSCGSCGSCDSCAGRQFSGYNDPYAGMYYESCGSNCLESLKRLLYAPLGLFCYTGCGSYGESRGGCGELYIGDYINDPPVCEPCDGYGNLRGYQAGCPTGNCNSCSTGSMTPEYSAPYTQYTQPYPTPQMMPSGAGAGCQSCGQGIVKHYSDARPVSSVPATGLSPSQQILLQDKLVGGAGQNIYQAAPPQQIASPYQQRYYR